MTAIATPARRHTKDLPEGAFVPPPLMPTLNPPGSLAKIDEMAERYLLRESLFHPDDEPLTDSYGYIVCRSRSGFVEVLALALLAGAGEVIALEREEDRPRKVPRPRYPSDDAARTDKALLAREATRKRLARRKAARKRREGKA
jgi:hypothetical protein